MKYIALATMFIGIIWVLSTPKANATQATYKATMKIVEMNSTSDASNPLIITVVKLSDGTRCVATSKYSSAGGVTCDWSNR